MRIPFIVTALPLAAAALIAAGCGSGSSGSSSQSSGSGSSTGATAASQGGGAYGAPSSSTAATSAAATGAAVVKTQHLGVGTVLVGPNGRTLYLFAKDRGPSSTCSGACAQGWPPLTTKGAPHAGAGAKASMLTTVKRPDGTTQVVYAGHPLYYYAGDTAPGQDAGQAVDAFGAPWYVVTPAGKQIA